jgi:hypothetical protein
MSPNSLQAQPKLHLYGGKAAVCLEATSTSQDLPTVTLEVAPKPDGYTVDWSQKIAIQLASHELVALTGLLLGYASALQCARQNKGIQIERQPGKVYIRASAGAGRMYGVPLTVGDTARAADFCLAQIVAGSFTGSVEASLAAVRGACALLRTHTPIR